MALNYNKLIKFDLINDIEDNLYKSDFKENFSNILPFVQTVQQIRNVDQFIRDSPSFPGSNKNMIRDEMELAIGSTLAIEGIAFTPEEIKETIKRTDLKDNLERKKQEKLNAEKVYAYIKKLVDNCKDEFIYQEEYIRKIHELFTDGVEYIGNSPGHYRNTSVSFGEPRKISLCGNYNDIYVAITNFIGWLNQKSDGILGDDRIVKAIMSHYYLTEIHPFGDGNGRTARAVEAMVLYVNGINPYCFWSLANFWSTHRNEYLVYLGDIRETCNPMKFLIWGANGYLEEVKRVKGRILKKVKQLMLQDYTRYLYQNKKQQPAANRINLRILSLLFHLTHSGGMPFDEFKSSPGYEALYFRKSKSASSKSRDLTKMKSLNLIRITSVEGKEFIEPNYDILDNLEYGI
jgi:Fic family protein